MNCKEIKSTLQDVCDKTRHTDSGKTYRFTHATLEYIHHLEDALSEANMDTDTLSCNIRDKLDELFNGDASY